MFDPSDRPRVFGVPPGVDFPDALIRGLVERHEGQPPEALARVQLVVNTRRMARRIRALFDEGPPRLLPRTSLVTDLGEHWNVARIPDPVPPLRRRLELARLISALLDRQPDLAPRSAIFDLADSLAALMDEMHGEGVPPGRIEALDISDESGHWERIRAFLGIVRVYFQDGATAPDAESRQRQVVEHLVRTWQDAPPDHPVIVAGSTGSRGATRLLMRAVSRLPQGAVILPGYDFDMPAQAWKALGGSAMSGTGPQSLEDHPQYRFFDFLESLDFDPSEIPEWTSARPVNPARNRVVSLALRPAPVTDQWLDDGPSLGDVGPAMRDVTLLEAPSPRIEALTIAMRLRQAAEDGQTAALITPDRTLTRQVTAALDRWKIRPDDSAGMPLHLSPPGRFLRHVADLYRNRLTAASLLTLLKHPLTHSGGDRGPHLRLTRELDLHLRRHGPPYPTADALNSWAKAHGDEYAMPWIEWLCQNVTGRNDQDERPLASRVAAHLALAERVAQGPVGDGAGRLWRGEDGRAAWECFSELAEHAGAGGALGAAEYTSLFQAVLSRGEVRNPVEPHPHILIWGTLEARVQGAELIILAGLNEGGWPEAPAPDPWLNRTLRQQAGLLLPERRIGLSAHDFQQAVLAPQVWLTRSVRSDDAETVPSRWLNRLQNLLAGLPGQGGAAALEGMRGRGRNWLRLAESLETPDPVPAATRPSPCPPAPARPHRLSVTEIKRLIRDPYAIYARHVLRLRPLDPLMKAPDALLRGIVLHDVLEAFIAESRGDVSRVTRDRLIEKTVSVLAENVPWAEARALWLARMERAADLFIDGELSRRTLAEPAAFEVRGSASIPHLDFTLTAKADRIDIDGTGALHLYDYKTGAAPSADVQRHFDKQLLLEAAIATRSGFEGIDPAQVARAVFISLGSGKPEEAAPIDAEPPEKVWSEFTQLMSAWAAPDMGYTSRRAMQKSSDRGDYDQLARYGEWDIADPPDRTEVG